MDLPQHESGKMIESSKNCILFFVKYPVRGAVKSRLAAELDDSIALELYKYFILDMLATLDTCQARCLICCHPEGSQKQIEDWLGTKYHYLPQEGKDLGERMQNGFITAFSMQCENAVLIGSDIPDLPRSIVRQALRMLKKQDAVIGPAHDGGYYLIGFRHDTFRPDIFDSTKWGGNTVLRTTLTRLKKSGCRAHLLPAWSDVDTLADVRELLQRNKSKPAACPNTLSYLTKWGQVSTFNIPSQSATRIC
jgi:hypothetical protein